MDQQANALNQLDDENEVDQLDEVDEVDQQSHALDQLDKDCASDRCGLASGFLITVCCAYAEIYFLLFTT